MDPSRAVQGVLPRVLASARREVPSIGRGSTRRAQRQRYLRLAAQVAVVGATTGAAGVATGDGVGLGVVPAVVVAGAGALAVTTFAGDVAATCFATGAVALGAISVAAGVLSYFDNRDARPQWDSGAARG
jgi:hypothetical protein